MKGTDYSDLTDLDNDWLSAFYLINKVAQPIAVLRAVSVRQFKAST